MLNYFQANLDYLGWNPVADATCDLTGEQGICLRPLFYDFGESNELNKTLEELKEIVATNHPGDDFFYVHLNAISQGKIKVLHYVDEDFQDGLNDQILDKLSRTPPYDGEGPWFMLDGDVLPFIGIWYSDDVEEYFDTEEEQQAFVASINGQYQEKLLTLDTMNLEGRTIVFQNSKDQSLFAIYEYQGPGSF